MKRLAPMLCALTTFGIALAMPTYPKAFQEHYKIKKGTQLFNASCAVCHKLPVNGRLNPYGQDLQKAMRSLKTKAVTPEALKRIEKLDSDRDGRKNIEEIKGDTNPGEKPKKNN